MRKSVVIYSSVYGSTKQYAQWLAEALDCGCLEAKDISPASLLEYDTLLFGGGLYAGGLTVAPLVKRCLPLMENRRMAVFTVGIADPDSRENRDHIRTELQKTFTAEELAAFRLFHLRGALDYSRMGLKHRAMMAMLKMVLQKKKPAERSEEDQQLLDTYGGSVSFLNRDSLRPLEAFARGGEEA